MKLKLQYFGHLIQKTDSLEKKNPDAGKGWRQEEKGTTEDEMVGCHHQLAGQEFEQAPGVGNRQGSLAFCSPWDCKKSDTTEWLNWTELTRGIKVIKLIEAENSVMMSKDEGMSKTRSICLKDTEHWSHKMKTFYRWEWPAN